MLLYINGVALSMLLAAASALLHYTICEFYLPGVHRSDKRLYVALSLLIYIV